MHDDYRVFASHGHFWRGVGLLAGCLASTATVFAQTNVAPPSHPVFKPVLAPAGTTPPKPKAAASPSGTMSTNSLSTGQNDDVHIFTSGNQQSEVHISIDKSSACNLIASANTLVSGGIQQGLYYSQDGGATWRGGDQLPNGGQGEGDPSTAYDAGGYAYLATISPNGDSYLVQSSTNKGTTWTNQLQAATPLETEFDKEMIAADNTAGSPYANNLYSAWTIFGAGNATTIKLNRSTDRGQSFSTPLTLMSPSSGHDTGTNVQTGPNGEVYVCWADYPNRTGGAASGIAFSRSTNGGASFTAPTIAFSKAGIETNGNQPDPLFNNTRVNDFPAMAVDKGNVHRGRIYIVSAAKENGNGKAFIQVSYSDNQGTSWSAPITASIATGRQNWFPWIAVDDSNGDVSVVYYSFDTASGFITNTYVAYSHDGGASFTNLKVSDVSHTTATIPGFAGGYEGDYLGITAYGGKAYPTWSDDRSGTWQLYTSPVTYAVIAGPSQFCSGTASYSASYLPAGASISWSSSNTNIATINASTGVATAVGSGVVTLRWSS